MFFIVVYLLSSVFSSLCRFLISNLISSRCQSPLCMSRPILYSIKLIFLPTSLLESLFRQGCHPKSTFVTIVGVSLPSICLGGLCSLCWTPFFFLALHLHFGRIHPTTVSCMMVSRRLFLRSCISKMLYRDWQTRASSCSVAWCLSCGSKS